MFIQDKTRRNHLLLKSVQLSSGLLAQGYYRLVNEEQAKEILRAEYQTQQPEREWEEPTDEQWKEVLKQYCREEVPQKLIDFHGLL